MDADQNVGHGGDDYRIVLRRLHRILSPATYFEIGTFTGESLRLSGARSVAVDPEFRLDNLSFAGECPMLALYNMTSDSFFQSVDPTVVLGGKIDLAFLDGMHKCEYLLRDFFNTERYCKPSSVIVLHDCLPPESSMTSRVRDAKAPLDSKYSGWWTGDVWRTALILKWRRPDLKIVALDAFPTGLVLITCLNPKSCFIQNSYEILVREMRKLDLEKIKIPGLFRELDVMKTSYFRSRIEILSGLAIDQ